MIEPFSIDTLARELRKLMRARKAVQLMQQPGHIEISENMNGNYFYTSDIPCFHVVHGIDLRRAELGDRSYARLKRNSRPKFFIGSLFIYALLTGACIVLIAFSRMLRLGFDPSQYSHWYQFSLMGFAQIPILLLVILAFLILLVILLIFPRQPDSWSVEIVSRRRTFVDILCMFFSPVIPRTKREVKTISGLSGSEASLAWRQIDAYIAMRGYMYDDLVAFKQMIEGMRE